MKKQKYLSILLIILPALAAVLTAMPGAVVMRFFAGENGYFLEKVSGFNRILVGYGQVFPGAAGCSAIVTTLFAIIGRDMKRIRSFAFAGAIFWCIAGIQGGFAGLGIGAMLLLAATGVIANYLCREDRL